MIKTLLIANRGEIACRVIKTAKRMGIRTIAVYSTVDKRAQHVELADDAYLLGPAPASHSYLNREKIIEIAHTAKANAIHPGYGFLAEDAAFAALCEKNCIIFVGPPAKAIAAMGDKREAKRIMEKSRVPVVPGYQGSDQNVKTLTIEAKKIGLPVLIKAAAGGGGKGMRLVTDLKQIENALQSAKREAKSGFGDDTIFLEKYIEPARHVEVQIFMDQQGHGVYLLDRDCSIQRRHQKIIEEAPAPHLKPATRKKMGETAVEAAKTIGYVGAGTIEFLVDDKESFYFMEMNTRLQVEHPVTEMITGLDLVEWQIRMANGESLPLTQKEIRSNGHAFEARLCAENPENNFAPSIGKLRYFHVPKNSESVRIDSGVRANDSVTPYYDPLIAKLITWNTDRASALKTLSDALENTFIVGVDTNVSFLHRICSNPAFQQEEIHTHFIEEHAKNLFLTEKKLPNEIAAFAAVAKWHQQQILSKYYAQQSEDNYSPWFTHDAWQSFKETTQITRLWHDDTAITLYLSHENELFHITDGHEFSVEIKAKWKNEHAFEVLDNAPVSAYFTDNQLHLFHCGEHYLFFLQNPHAATLAESTTESRFISPMPGTVIEILVKAGQSVKKGDRLLILEAMKMEHTIEAHADGVIKSIPHKAGDLIQEGVELIEFESSSS